MTRILPGLLVMLVLVVAAPAQARSPEIGIADDRVLMPGDATANEAVAEWKELGIDTVRIFALWRQVAPGTKKKKRPAGFQPADPNDPGYHWFYLDNAVERVRRAGMKIDLTVTGPGPLWTSSKPKKRKASYKPRPSAYAAFAKAVALRYGDRVDRYFLWNEPNLPLFLSPQARCKRGVCIPVSPHLYRGLVRAAYPAIHRADPGAQVIIGVTSPRGHMLKKPNVVMRPLLFLRQLGCRTDTWSRSRIKECRKFKPAKGDGYSIHPYSGRIPPEQSRPHSDDVSLSAIPNLTKALDRLKRKGALRSSTRKMGIYIDEYGFQTNPPDPFLGISRRKQDSFLQRAAYVAWRNPRIKLFTQYLWRDEPGTRGWQSGLRFHSGKPKPSLRHFDTPFVLDAKRNRLWGQVRPGGRHTVTVQRRPKGSKKWRRVARVRTNAAGYWTIRRKLRTGSSYRYRVSGGQTSATLRR